MKIHWVDCRNTPDFAVAGFSAPAAGVLSFCSVFVVVVTGATVAGGLVLLVALLAKGAAAGCLGVTVVLLGVGLCTVDAAAGLGVGLGATVGILEVTGLAGLGGAAFTTGGLSATGVVDWMVVDMTLGTACFSCFTTGIGFGDGTAKAGRNGFESPCSNLYIFSNWCGRDAGFSLGILIAGERCNVTGGYCERGSTSEFKIVIGYRTFTGEFCIVN